ncbi:extracellular solute-binding protein [Mannheimia granulomatis]|uniref:extracellular solute-binding protein n=1 Tax=Mannheimia granulomatis TaxID=85402 RepID=UPI00159D31ED|nr:extracellular solute-binding protein [Mannheimia granulomatis]
MIITMKDIAKEANVSLGTVSNVLNGKSNVSLVKIEKVQAAVEKLGYRKNIQASNLKSGTSNKVAIILPNITEMKYACLYENLDLLCARNNLSLTLYLTHNRESKEKQIIQNIKQENYLCIVMDSCLSDANYCYNELKDTEKCIFVYRKIKNAKHFVGFNYKPIIREMIEHIKNSYLREVVFIKDDHCDWSEALCNDMAKLSQEHHINLSFLVQYDSVHKLSFELAQRQYVPDGLISPSFDSAKILYSTFYLSNKKPPKIYSFYKNSFEQDNRFIQYRLDYDFISNQVLSVILGQDVSNQENHFGFSTLIKQERNIQSDKTEINLLAVQTPSIEAIRKLVPYFQMLTGINVNIDTFSFDEIPDILKENCSENKYDLVRIDMESLPYFSDKYLLPLENIDVAYLKRFFSESIVEKFCVFQNKLYAIPFDPSIQMLFYRKDIFNDVKVKRLFYEKHKKQLNLPKNFEQFNMLSAFFKENLPKELGIKYGSALIINDIGTLATEFLMRYYALSNSIFIDDILQLDIQPAKKALKQLKIFYSSSKLLENAWWRDSVELFNSGEIPMLIVYMNHFSPLSQKGFFPLGVSTLPNNRALMGGGSLAIIKQTTKREACEKFLVWFLDNTTQEQYVRLGGSTAKQDIVENQNMTKNLPWLLLALKEDFKGIRENSNSKQEAINLRQAENIIGNVVSQYLITDMEEGDAIDMINARLSSI